MDLVSFTTETGGRQKSGKGKAMKIAHEHVLPILGEAEIEYTLLKTEYQNHAVEIANGY